MIEKHQIISDMYHFISDMLLIFILAIPVMHFFYGTVPFFSHLIIILLSCIIFTLVEKVNNNYTTFIFTLPILHLLFWTFNYPLLLNLVFSVLFVWRYLNIRNDLVTNRGLSYIMLTGFSSVCMYLITKEIAVMIYLILQFIILVFGFILSQIAVVDKQIISKLNYYLGLYYIGLLSLVGFVCYWVISQFYLFQLWDKIVYVIFSFVGRILYIFPFTEEFEFKRAQNIAGMGTSEEGVEYSNSALTTIASIFGVNVLIGVFISLFGVFMLMMIYRKDYSPLDVANSGKVMNIISTSYNSLIIKSVLKSKMKNFVVYKRHPIRKLIYDFERKAKKGNYGRKKFETLEDWLPRIGIQEKNLESYQRIRYGNMDVSEREVEDLKRELDMIYLSIKEKR
jgi:hypothetical protein